MTGSAQRWKRILAIRSVQRQMAEAQFFRCEAELRNLVDLGGRIAAIRDAAQPFAGTHDGLMLRSICELSSRLDSAQVALANPSQSASEARDRQQRAVIAAKQRETAVEKLEVSISRQETKDAVDRQNRTSIFRQANKMGAVT